MRDILRPAFFVAALVAVGCSVNLSEPEGRACDRDHSCQPGLVCRDSVCVLAGSISSDGGADGGHDAGGVSQPDAGPQSADVTVDVTPKNAKVPLSQTLQLTATVMNTTDQRVTWSVVEGAAGGSITAGGVYTAPGQSGSYTVRATSVAGPTSAASVTVVVRDGSLMTTGLVAHYSAKELNGVSMGLPAEGAKVNTWTDLSGNLRHLTQATSTKQPAFKTNAINGLPGLLFDGMDDHLLLTSAFAVIPQPTTIFVVFVGPAGQCTLVDAPVGTTERNRIQWAEAAPFTGVVALQLFASKFSSLGVTRNANAPYYATAIFDGEASSQMRVNGALDSLFSGPGTAGMGGIQVGFKQDLQLDTSKTPGAPLISEILIYGRRLTLPEIEQVEFYLASRYGL